MMHVLWTQNEPVPNTGASIRLPSARREFVNSDGMSQKVW